MPISWVTEKLVKASTPKTLQDVRKEISTARAVIELPLSCVALKIA
jgi:hypothetical protein